MTQTIDSSPKAPTGATVRDDRRKRLREFQSDLVERVQAARSSTEAAANLLGVQIGLSRWLIDLQEVGEIVAVGSITRVPLAQNWYLGLTNLRGNLVGVIDFARYQGHPPTDMDSECRIITIAARFSHNCGLLVSRILGLRNMTSMTLQESGPDESGEMIEKYLDQESVPWSRLRISSLVQEPRFMQIGK